MEARGDWRLYSYWAVRAQGPRCCTTCCSLLGDLRFISRSLMSLTCWLRVLAILPQDNSDGSSYVPGSIRNFFEPPDSTHTRLSGKFWRNAITAETSSAS